MICEMKISTSIPSSIVQPPSFAPECQISHPVSLHAESNPRSGGVELELQTLYAHTSLYIKPISMIDVESLQFLRSETE